MHTLYAQCTHFKCNLPLCHKRERLLFHVEISSLMLDAALRECLTAATGITAGFFYYSIPLIFLSLTCHSGVLIHCKWSATSMDTAAAVHLVSDLMVSLIPAWPFESREASFDFNLMGGQEPQQN